MSASRSSRSSRSSRARNSKKKAARPTTFTDVLRPLRTAIADAATAALDLAEREVEDWPVARERVKNTRRSVNALLSDRRAKKMASADDIMFTASLIARIVDEQLGLGASDALAVLDYLDLPIDDVPLPGPRPRTAPRPMPVAPTRIPMHRATEPTPTVRLRTPPPLRFCDECGYVHEPGDHIGYRNAA